MPGMLLDRVPSLLLALSSLLLLSLTACSGSDAQRATQPAAQEQGAASSQASKTRETVAAAPLSAEELARLQAAGGVAYFAGGCFWGVEHFLEMMEGVAEVESGFMGGHVEQPSYEDVLSHESGHLETVRVIFNPDQVSYEAVAKRFFEIHDPTQRDGQGPDIGPQYLSAVFVTDAAQREVVESLIRRLRDRGYDVATTIRDAKEFWPAEDYHQDYYAKHNKTPYCHAPVDRFGD